MKKSVGVFIIVFTLLLTSCANPLRVLPKRNYVSTDITYSESTAQYAFRLNMDSTETEFAKFFFESSIENEDREACIETTDHVLSSQSFGGGIVPEIYIFSHERYDGKYISSHKLYSSIQD